MNDKIIRFDAYFDTKCVNCALADCNGDCFNCKNWRILKCACLQIKGKEEKNCPFFKRTKNEHKTNR